MLSSLTYVAEIPGVSVRAAAPARAHALAIVGAAQPLAGFVLLAVRPVRFGRTRALRSSLIVQPALAICAANVAAARRSVAVVDVLRFFGHVVRDIVLKIALGQGITCATAQRFC